MPRGVPTRFGGSDVQGLGTGIELTQPPAGGGGSGSSSSAQPPTVTDEWQAVRLGYHVVWTGAAGPVIPAASYVGQSLVVASVPVQQPDGTAITVQVGETLVWDGTQWVVGPAQPGGGTTLPVADQADAVAVGLHVVWTGAAELPAGVLTGQSLQIGIAGPIEQPGGGTAVTGADLGTFVMWDGAQWVVVPVPGSGGGGTTLPATNRGDAVAWGFTSTMATYQTQLPAGGTPGQLLLVVDDSGGSTPTGTFTQPGGAGTINVEHGDWLEWDGVSAWVLSFRPSGGGGTTPQLPAVDEAAAVALGTHTAWTGAGGTTLPAGVRVGQTITAYVSNQELFQPDGTTSIGIVDVGDVLVWAGAGWVWQNMAHGDEITALRGEALLKADNLDQLADVVTARDNLDVYSEAEVDALIAAAGAGGDMVAANNLSDVASVPTARANLDVYSKSETDSAIAAHTPPAPTSFAEAVQRGIPAARWVGAASKVLPDPGSRTGGQIIVITGGLSGTATWSQPPSAGDQTQLNLKGGDLVVWDPSRDRWGLAGG